MDENDKQADPVAQPYAYVYEFDSGMFGIHRSFSSNERNGSKPSRVVPVYTHPTPTVAQAEPVGEVTSWMAENATQCFKTYGDDALPIGSKLYIHPAPAVAQEPVLKATGIHTEQDGKLYQFCEVLSALMPNPGTQLYTEAPAVAVNGQLLRAAKKYFTRYCLDEASEFGPDDTGCSQEQHQDALELGEAIAEAEKSKGGWGD